MMPRIVTENDSADGHTFDSVVSRGIGNTFLEDAQTNEGVGAFT